MCTIANTHQMHICFSHTPIPHMHSRGCRSGFPRVAVAPRNAQHIDTEHRRFFHSKAREMSLAGLVTRLFYFFIAI